MSLIIHRCTSCQKPDYWARGGTIASGRTVNGKQPAAEQRRGCCRNAGWSDPEIVPTWGQDGQLEATLIAPGQPAPGGARACGCDDCVALFERATEAVPA